ncbi:MAG: alpha/beta fold hydrolase [Pirellulales bacterium]|nr:alpha/beta fold hydrolase [Pirellulales bacterium]
MRKTDDWRPLYPFQSREIKLAGRRCHYVDEGEGPTILLVHGNPTWSFYWREIILSLRGRYRLVAPDLIGMGLSEKPSPRDYSYRLRRRVDDLNELIEKLDLQHITLTAHDWGGAIGMGAAVAAPRRFARFALMNTAAFPAPKCPWKIRACRIPLFGPLAVQGLNLFVAAALRTTVAKPERITPAVRAGLAAPYDSWRNRTGVLRFVLDIPLHPAHPSHDVLKGIEEGLALFRNHPVCLIWGMLDWCFTPWFLERFIDIFPQAEVHRFADAGHYVVEDAHERIAPLLEEFIGRHSG